MPTIMETRLVDDEEVLYIYRVSDSGLMIDKLDRFHRLFGDRRKLGSPTVGEYCFDKDGRNVEVEFQGVKGTVKSVADLLIVPLDDDGTDLTDITREDEVFNGYAAIKEGNIVQFDVVDKKIPASFRTPTVYQIEEVVRVSAAVYRTAMELGRYFRSKK